MARIKNVNIEFSCPETLTGGCYCEKCSHQVVDFRNKTNNEFRAATNKASGPVCGLFKRSQLSDQFLRYAAATFIATSLTAPVVGQKVIKSDSLLKASERVEIEDEGDDFLGIIVETAAAPVGGFKKFYAAISSKLNYPAGLTAKGKSWVQFTIDKTGQMRDVKLVKSFNEMADKEALRVLSNLEFPFTPGLQRGKAVETKLVLPIVFDPENGRR